MADTKPKKPAATKKIVDVKSGGDAASGTSRQIIVNNRPIMKDPMMAEVSELANTQAGVAGEADDGPAAAETPGAPQVEGHGKTIAVAHVDIADDSPAAADQAKTSKTTAKKATAKPAKAATTATDITATTQAKPTADEPDTANEAVEPEPNTEATAEPATSATDESATDKADEPPAVNKSDPKAPDTENTATADDDSSDKYEDKSGGQAAAAQPGRSFDETESPVTKPDDNPPEEEIELDKHGKPKRPKQVAPGQLTTEQQKAVDSEHYFLPITTAETRRLRKEIVLTVLIMVLLIAGWLDLMLDAGLLHVSGLHAVTHFFSS